MKQQKHSKRSNRDVLVRVRVTLAEKHKLTRLADELGLSISDMIRLKTVGTKPLLRKPTPEKELLLKFLASFGKASSNLNQLQRSINRKQHSEDFELPLAYINYLLAEMKTIMNNLRNAFNRDHQGKN